MAVCHENALNKKVSGLNRFPGIHFSYLISCFDDGFDHFFEAHRCCEYALGCLIFLGFPSRSS